MLNLTTIILAPLLGALVITCIPRNYRFVIRIVALATLAISAVVGFWLFASFNPAIPGFQYPQQMAWVPAIGISYHVGADGINIGLIFMSTLVAFCAGCASWEIKSREKEFYFLLLLMAGGVHGAFCSLDLFFFFAFHELALIPTFIMIGIWGRGEETNYATFKITLYLTIGALLTLAGLIALYFAAGANTFDIVQLSARLQSSPLSGEQQALIFPFLLFGFGILVSLWPFHTWAPIGYGAAPTATAMLHAGALKKFGLYGLIRIAIPLMPEAAANWLNVIAILCLGNILYCGMVAMRQRSLNLLIGNSSVAHMGFVFLGIITLTTLGVTGAVTIMVAHGFLAAVTFALSGYLYQQSGHSDMSQLGGLLKRMPFIGTALLMAFLAGCGLPGFANFIGEAMVLFSAWKAFPIVTSLAVWGGLVIGAVYMLRAARQLLHGPITATTPNFTDAAGAWRKLPFVLLLAALLILGCAPFLLVEKIRPAAERIVKRANSVPARTAEASKLHLANRD